MEISFDNTTPLIITRPTIIRCAGCDRRFGTDDGDTVPNENKRYWVGGDFSQTKTHQLHFQHDKHWCDECLAKIYNCELCQDTGVDDNKPFLMLSPQMVLGIDETRKMCPRCVDAISTHTTRCRNTDCMKTYVSAGVFMTDSPAVNRVKRWVEGFHFAPEEISAGHLLRTNDVGAMHDVRGRCDNCTHIANCYFCNTTTIEATTIDVVGQNLVGFPPGTNEIQLCGNCNMGHITCACKKVVAVDFTTRLDDGRVFCNDCVNVGPDGKMIYDPEGAYANTVIDITAFDPTTVNQGMIVVDHGFETFVAERRPRTNTAYVDDNGEVLDEDEDVWEEDEDDNAWEEETGQDAQFPTRPATIDRIVAGMDNAMRTGMTNEQETQAPVAPTRVVDQFNNLTAGFETGDPFADQ